MGVWECGKYIIQLLFDKRSALGVKRYAFRVRR
jgi:hypothetical protein